MVISTKLSLREVSIRKIKLISMVLIMPRMTQNSFHLKITIKIRVKISMLTVVILRRMQLSSMAWMEKQKRMIILILKVYFFSES